MRNKATVAAALLALCPTLAEAAEAPCLSTDEFSALAGYALPSAISGASKRCSPTLPADSYLRSMGGQLSQRYSERKEASWIGAKAAFFKLSAAKDANANNLLRQLPDDALKTMVDVMLEGMVSQEIPLTKCGTIDHFLRLLGPLPPQNMAELVTLVVDVSSKDKEPKAGDLRICRTDHVR